MNSNAMSNVRTDNGTAVQIIASENHQLELNVEEFQRIFGCGHLDDHYVVVISIAGPLRTGKSFILNFFLKYLRAQVSRICKIHIFKHICSIMKHFAVQNK